MAIVKMTLAEALVRRKTYEQRIEQLTNDLETDTIARNRRFLFCDFYTGTKKVGEVSGVDIETFEKNTKASIDSIMAIISNYETLCKAINKKNNETTVVIADKEMTIVEAIALKNGLVKDFRVTLAKKLMADYNAISAKAKLINEKVNDPDNIDKYLDQILTDDAKNDPAKVKEAETTYHEMRDANIVDPLNIVTMYDDIINDAKAFKDEVDFRLSEVNAKTEIEVEFAD